MTEEMEIEARRLSIETTMNYDQSRRYVISKQFLTNEEIAAVEKITKATGLSQCYVAEQIITAKKTPLRPI